MGDWIATTPREMVFSLQRTLGRILSSYLDPATALPYLYLVRLSSLVIVFSVLILGAIRFDNPL